MTTNGCDLDLMGAGITPFVVMLGLVPSIHVSAAAAERKAWMVGTIPTMTGESGL